MDNNISIVNKDLNQTIEAFEKIKQVAEYLASSDAFVTPFEVKDKEGKTIIDDITNKPKINIADIAICLMTGRELGLNIAGSLLLGKKLNQATYLSIIKGRSIGVDLATSMEKIISIPSKKGGLTSYTMVDIISAKLLQGGVQFLPFVKNYAPFYLYQYYINGEEADLDKILDEEDNLKDEYVIVDSKSTADYITKAKEAGKTFLTKTRRGYYSKAKFVRTFEDGSKVIHFQRFSTVDAERAELLPTWDAKGNLIQKGKDNWTSNTPQMMNNRVISIGGRIIGADLLNGLYTKEELIDANIIDDDGKPPVTVDVEAKDITNETE